MDYISPIIEGLQPGQTIINNPPDSAACLHCPAAVWMLRGAELINYCRVMHVVVWSEEERACPDRCDGQVIALAELQPRKTIKQQEDGLESLREYNRTQADSNALLIAPVATDPVGQTLASLDAGDLSFLEHGSST